MSEKSERVKAWRSRTKENLINGFGGACQLCGYKKCPSSLAFHHKVPSEKDFSFGAIRANIRSWDRIVEEIKKCVMLCHNCHCEVHSGITLLPEDLPEFDVSKTEQFQKEMKRKYSNRLKKCIDCNQETMSTIRSGVKRCTTCQALSRRKIVWPPIDELSKLVWETPTKQIANKLGVSDAAVTKYCKKNNISKPPRGYWTKKN